MPSSGTRAYPTEDLVLGADAIFAVSPQVAAAALYGSVGSYTLNDAARAISALIGSPVAVQGEPTFLGRWTVGDGTSSSFTITHGLADGSPHVTVWDYSQAPPQLIGASVSLSGTDPENTIVVSAEDWVASPPGPGSIVVAIVGGPPAEGVEGADATMVFTDAGPLTIVNEPAAGNVLTGVDPNHAQFTAPTGGGGGAPTGAAGGDLSGTYPNPSVGTVKGGKTPLTADQNLADVTAATARTNLGLGTAATHPSTDFDSAGAGAAAAAASDPSGSAATAQAAAIAASAQALVPTVVKTGAYTAAAGDFVPVDISGGSVTVTLPNAPADKTRIGVKVVKISGTPGSTSCTVARAGSDVFNVAAGSTSLTLTALFQGVLLQYSHSAGIWYVSTADSPIGTALGAAKLGSDGTVGGPGGSGLTGSVVSDSQLQPGQYLCAFNGDSNVGQLSGWGGAGYAIGLATSEDGGRSFRRVPGGPILSRLGSAGWDNGYVKDPSICFVGRRLFLAYMGTSDGAANSIGLAIWNNGTPIGVPDVRVQLIAPGGVAWATGSLGFPHLFYDESAGVLHIWYMAQATGGTTVGSIGHATIDPNSLVVTQDAGNPIIAPGAGEGGFLMGCVFLDHGTWQMFVNPFNVGATTCVPVRFTAPAITGPWTRQGQVFSPRPTAIKALTVDAAIGDAQVQVADSSVFVVGDAVYIQDSLATVNPGATNPDNWEVNYVKAIPDGTHVTLRNLLIGSYTTARSAEIVAVDQAKVLIRSCSKDGNTYVLWAVGWFQGNQTYHEDAFTLTTSALATTPYTLARDRGLMLTKTGSAGATRGAWDKQSSENPSVIAYARGRQLVATCERSATSRAIKRVADWGGVASATWAPLRSGGSPDTFLDCWLPARAGDVFRIAPCFSLSNEAVWFYMDVVVVLYAGGGSTYGSWASGGSGATPPNTQGIMGWRAPPSVYVLLGAPILYTVQAADIILGNIGLRPMYKLSSGVRYGNSSGGTTDWQFTYENLGGGES